ncbi:hypothetical protein E2C01_065257 [Portunus trituberculatus]|uniref:Uncharacterized protein n=1 Tax=Portunus trituberculatus TaxID=210409 RepID=A0A5B7HF49_PORTR|nr:hypothetical protein [Portunus trituberculatus]
METYYKRKHQWKANTYGPPPWHAMSLSPASSVPSPFPLPTITPPFSFSYLYHLASIPHLFPSSYYRSPILFPSHSHIPVPSSFCHSLTPSHSSTLATSLALNTLQRLILRRQSNVAPCERYGSEGG